MTDLTPPLESKTDPVPDPSWDFRAAAQALLPSLTDEQFRNLEAYRELFLFRNTITNLSAIRTQQGIEQRLIAESLRLVEPLRQFLPEKLGRIQVLDIGTGGGIPGMILGITCPELDVTLLDATGKKVKFLGDVATELKLDNVRTIHGRAEDIARNPRYREAFDLATARAVANLSTLMELGIPLIRKGGYLLMPKGADLDQELAEGESAANQLGAQIRAASFLPEGKSLLATRLVVVEKIKPTSGKFPRRAGIPARSPLGRRDREVATS